ncbi:MAG: carbohydrate kinase, partial [Firmicutes bacterium]|nr:carbohydrate kinase [Bacillota bacterium]
KEVVDSGVGAHGVLLIPHFKGSAAPYWNPVSRGMFFNVSLETKRGDFARAILEGISIEMSQNIRLIEDLVGYVEIVNIAGGLTVFDEFNRIQADVFNKAITVYESAEATALGAFISTLVSTGVYENHQIAYDALFTDVAKKTYHSISSNVHKYITIRKMQKQLYNAINEAQLYNYFKIRTY